MAAVISPELKREIEALASLDLGDLRIRWRQHLRTAPPPHLSRPLMVRLVAYRIQARMLGDLDRDSARLLDRIAKERLRRRAAAERAAKPKAPPLVPPIRRPGFGPARCWCGSSGVRSTPSLWWRVGLPGGRRPMPACRRSLVRSPAPAGTDPASSGCGTR